ncbi:hypothetical protein DPM19_07895 [Actinomadura craniellae]|uniref:Uncharacterized protein n=1 Tax=Actinomadura craniellae TaxID=2231787 RepID=A0A365H9D9_9ACTN|nr:hypothetical protein [Actinomadura craniellae]RAY15697.1 hypothetical protein DPM19_07895 [Actinomadura craniellae]
MQQTTTRPLSGGSRPATPVRKASRRRRRALTGSLVMAATAGALVLTPGTAHAYPVESTRHCMGDQVERCAWINYDPANNRIRGYATVRDVPGRTSYTVDVFYVRILQCNSQGGNCTTEVVNTYNGDAGGSGSSDTGSSGLMQCGYGAVVRAEAGVGWHAPGEVWTVGLPVSHTFRC